MSVIFLNTIFLLLISNERNNIRIYCNKPAFAGLM